MLIGYARIGRGDGREMIEAQRQALRSAGVDPRHIYEDVALGKREERPALLVCLKGLQKGDTLVVWKLNRIGRRLGDLVGLIQELSQRGVGFQVLAASEASLDTTTALGPVVASLIATLAAFDQEQTAGRAKRREGRAYKMTAGKLQKAMLAMSRPDGNVGQVCLELGISRQTLYRYVAPDGSPRPDAQKLLQGWSRHTRDTRE